MLPLARKSRGRLLAATMTMAMLAAAPIANSAASPAPRTLPDQGVYDSCIPAKSADRCESRLARIGAAGFRAVVNGSVFTDASVESLLAYADAAERAHVKVIWPLQSGLGFTAIDALARNLLSSQPGLAAACSGCSDNLGLLAFVVGLLRSHPATWGYYLADEPRPPALGEVTDLANTVARLDPDHPRIVLGCGICSGGDPTGSNIAFLSGVNAVLGTDAYPVVYPPVNAATAAAKVRTNAASLRKVAGPGGVVTLQAWRWGDSPIDVEAANMDGSQTRFPATSEITAMRDAAVTAAQPRLVLWFNLTQVIGWEPGQGLSYWAQPTDTTVRWNALVTGAFAKYVDPAVAAFKQAAARRRAKLAKRRALLRSRALARARANRSRGR